MHERVRVCAACVCEREYRESVCGNCVHLNARDRDNHIQRVHMCVCVCVCVCVCMCVCVKEKESERESERGKCHFFFWVERASEERESQ